MELYSNNPYVNPSDELIEDILDCISEKFNYFVYRTHREVIYRVLSVCYRNKYFKQKQDSTFSIEDYALGRFFKNLIRQANHTGGAENQSYSEIIQEVSNIFYNTYQEYYDENINGLIRSTNNLIIAKIYPNCSEKNKEIIKKHFEKWIGDISWKSFEMYYYIVMNNIIEPNENYEKLILDRLNDIKEASRNCYPNDYQNILVTMCNLYMSSKLIHTDKFKIIVKGSDDIELMFLSDMDNFDYRKFNLEWLKMYSVGLLDEIYKNNTARYEISKIYAEKVEHGEIDARLLRLYFKHFVNVVKEN